MENQWLQAAIAAIELHDIQTARALLIAYTAQNETDPTGWLWLSRVTDSQVDKIQVLQRVLSLDPQQPEALMELAALYGPRRRPQPAARRGRGERVRAALGWLAFGFAAILLAVVLAAVVPLFSGNRSLVVLSGSMEPAIGQGDVVVARPVPSRDLQVGDVIAFSANPDSAVPIVHRIVSIHEDKGVRYFTTRGDANRSSDTAEVSLPATAWRVAYDLPKVGYVLGWATSPTGAMLLIGAPVSLLVALSLKDFVKKQRRLDPIFAGLRRH